MLSLHHVHLDHVSAALTSYSPRLHKALLNRRANDLAKEGRRATVTAQDVIMALRELEFDDFLPTLETTLVAYREAEKIRSLDVTAKRAASAVHQNERPLVESRPAI